MASIDDVYRLSLTITEDAVIAEAAISLGYHDGAAYPTIRNHGNIDINTPLDDIIWFAETTEADSFNISLEEFQIENNFNFNLLDETVVRVDNQVVTRVLRFNYNHYSWLLDASLDIADVTLIEVDIVFILSGDAKLIADQMLDHAYTHIVHLLQDAYSNEDEVEITVNTHN